MPVGSRRKGKRMIFFSWYGLTSHYTGQRCKCLAAWQHSMGQSLKLHTLRIAGATEDEGGLHCCLLHLLAIYHTSEGISSRLWSRRRVQLQSALHTVCDHQQYSAFPHPALELAVLMVWEKNAIQAAAVLTESRSQLMRMTASGRLVPCVLKMLKAAFWKDFKEMMSLAQQLGVWSFLCERTKAFHTNVQRKWAAQYFRISIQIWKQKMFSYFFTI